MISWRCHQTSKQLFRIDLISNNVTICWQFQSSITFICSLENVEIQIDQFCEIKNCAFTQTIYNQKWMSLIILRNSYDNWFDKLCALLYFKQEFVFYVSKIHKKHAYNTFDIWWKFSKSNVWTFKNECSNLNWYSSIRNVHVIVIKNIRVAKKSKTFHWQNNWISFEFSNECYFDINWYVNDYNIKLLCKNNVSL